MFDAATQDSLADNTLKSIGMDEYLKGGISTEDFIGKISGIWASVPKDSTGERYL